MGSWAHPPASLPWLPWLHEQLDGAWDPWIDALKLGVRFRWSGSAHKGSTLDVTIRTEHEPDMRVFEGLELLALLSGIDPTLFCQLAMSVSADHIQYRTTPPSAQVVAIKCTIHVGVDDDFPVGISQWCERLVLAGVEATGSSDYARVRGLLESAYAMVDDATPPNRLRLRRELLVMNVHVHAFGGDCESRAAQFAQVARTQRARDGTVVLGWKPIFRVASMDMAPGMTRSISAKAFLHITDIVRCGIDIPSLFLHRMDVKAESAVLFARGLQVLAGIPSDYGTRQFPIGAVKDIQLPEFMIERTVSAVFSALTASQTVESVAINNTLLVSRENRLDRRSMSRAQRDHLWKWIALALFSAYASHRIERIRIEVQTLVHDDVAAFRQALQNPEVVMQPPGELGVMDGGFRRCYASDFMLTAPCLSVPGGFETAIRFAQQDVLVEETTQSQDWLRVIVPGCGQAWVHRRSITPHQCNTQLDAPISQPNLTICNVTDQSLDPVLGLLQAVGHRLKQLRIIDFKTRKSLDDWLHCLVLACPYLEELEVTENWNIDSMSVFAKMFESPACQLRSLHLEKFCVRQTASLTELVSCLGDPAHAISRKLRRLGVDAQHVDATLVDIIPTIDDMLIKNPVLQDLRFCIDYQPHIAGEHFLTTASLCEKHRGKPVSVRKGPLPLPLKLAFCSVVNGFDHRPNKQTTISIVPPAVAHLDYRMISLIFEYAAECEARDVWLELRTEQDRRPDSDSEEENDLGDEDEEMEDNDEIDQDD